jgi:conjugal transfer mating pair stabilization protein TraN
MKYIPNIFLSVTLSLLIIMMLASNSFAGGRFQSKYSCSDSSKACASSGTRVVDGFSVHRDCWEWQYTKRCNVPSKNNCAKYAHCYSLGQKQCLLRDHLGNCINLLKEFSCKRWTPDYVESNTVRYGLEDKDGQEGLLCTGIPCFDGNCIDKSYDMDTDMVQSISQLGAMSKGKRDDVNIKIFEGVGRRCSKKFTGYTNCCAVKLKGWGESLGAKCQPDEAILAEFRQKNLCISVGSEPIKAAGVKVGKKHHYCCFSNIIEKTVQVEGRKQLGLNFCSGGNPNCRGLTLKEIQAIDWKKIDYSEIAAEMHKKIAIPDIEDVEGRIKDSFKSTQKFDNKHPSHPSNKSAGVNKQMIGK